MRARRLLYWSLVLAGILVSLVAGVLAAPVVRRDTEYFGGLPLYYVKHWAEEEKDCGLTKLELAAMMLAPTYYETGAVGHSEAPSPMTLSRWDTVAVRPDNINLYSFSDPNTCRRAFWHPGVGMWQYDSAGAGTNLGAEARISSWSSAEAAASDIVLWHCNYDDAWFLWGSCDDGSCEQFFNDHYDAGNDQLVDISEDWDINLYGGAEWHRCRFFWQDSDDTWDCLYVNPNQAQGYAGSWTTNPEGGEGTDGPTPLTSPFYTFESGNLEVRYWLDYIYSNGQVGQVAAWRHLGDDVRDDVAWFWFEESYRLCDETTGNGCGVHLSDVRNAGGWISSIVIHNNSASSAEAVIHYYNISGDRVSGQKVWIAGNGSVTKIPPSGFNGSAIVSGGNGGEDVSVVVRNKRQPSNSYAAASGIPASETSDGVHLPVVMREYYDWYTVFRVQNAGTQATQVIATYYNQSGGTVCSVERYLQPNGRANFNQSHEDHNCLEEDPNPNGFNGSAVVTSESGMPLAIHLRERHESAPYLFSYPGFPSGAQTLYFPALFSRGYGAWSASLSLKNLGASSAYVTIEFKPTLPESPDYSCTDRRWISTSFSAWLPEYPGSYCDFPTGWIGSAKVVSTRSLVGVVNEIDEASGSYRAGTYSGIAGGSTTVVLPYLPRNDDGWSGSLTIQNLGSSSTNVTIKYYRDNGTGYTRGPYSINAGESLAWYLPDVSGLPNGRYSALVTSDGQPIGGMANAINTGVSGDGFVTYNGRNR